MNDAYSGVIQGGWEYVVAAYTVSALVLGGLFLSVHLRYRRERARRLREEGGRP